MLREREAAGQPFRESDLIAIAVPLAEGLAHIHKAGVIHRDIKPANILVRWADQQPVLIDFGAAKQAVAEHSRLLAAYTEGYAAPEQVAGGRLGPWTDSYGFGAVLWRMVAGGNRPWEPPNLMKVEQRSHAVVSGMEDPMPLASELGEGMFPAELLEVIDGCLRLRETERVQGSHEHLEVLCEVSEPPAGGVAEVARPVAERTGAEPWIRYWDALGDIRDPGFAKTERAYIERYTEVPEASVWIAKAEGLLAELRELESASPTQREAGESWTNSRGMEFVWVPARSFLMGSPKDKEWRFNGECQHEVRISEGFWMGRYAVTQGEWVAVMGMNPSKFSYGGTRYPVENVSWHQVQAFIRRLNERESASRYVYRLPAEAEWEYAARAGTPGVRHGELDEIAWYSENSGKRTHPVGQKRANAWGLHDMLGNVAEWVGDWYDGYPSGPVTAPRGPQSGSHRVLRGGS